MTYGGADCPNKQIRFKTAMLRSSLCDYGDVDIMQNTLI